MRTIWLNSTAMVAIVLALLSLSNVEAAKASPNTPVLVGVTEGDLFITPSPIEVSGDHFITFNVVNVSPFVPHELVIIRLKKGQTYDNLPIGMDPTSEYFGGVDENILSHQNMGEIGEEALPAGGSAALELGLPSGDYALICNLPGHYLSGMRSLLRTVGH